MLKLLIAIYVIATAFGLIILKLGAEHGPPFAFSGSKLALNLNYYALTGIALYGFSFILYTYLVAKFDLGYIIPLTTGLVYVLIFVSSYIIFKEAFTALKVTGILLILGGLILLNIKR